MNIILSIYLYGIIISIAWWTILSFFVFRDYKEGTDLSFVDSIHDLQNTLVSAFPDSKISLENKYLILSLLVTFAWPIFLFLFMKNKLKL